MISVSTTSLKEHHDAVNAVQQLADSGILNIELGADHNYPVDEKRIIQMKKEFGLSYTVHAFFPPTKEKFIVNIGTGDKEKLKISLDVIKNSLEFVNEAEAKLYSMHPGFSTSIDLKGNPLDKPIERDRCIEIIKNSLAEISDYAKRYGIKIAVENLSRSPNLDLVTRPTKIAGMLKELNLKNFGLLIDAGHLNIAATAEGFDKKKEIEKVQDKILELHISENNGKTDEHKPITNMKMLDCFNKEMLKNKILTLEGQSNWSIKDIKKSIQILNSSL